MAWVNPRTWASGLVTVAMMNEIRDSLKAVGDAPPSYTPTILAGWTSNYTIAGYAQNVGKWWKGAVNVTFTGTPAGSGPVNITLPATPAAASAQIGLGKFSVYDVSTNLTNVGTVVSRGTAYMAAYTGTSTQVANAAPITYATGDVAWFTFEFWTD